MPNQSCRRATLALCLGLALAAGACRRPPEPHLEGEPRLEGSTEILWDSWGVPHVFADDGVGLSYGFGWAQAHNHADLILRLMAAARGRSAEYWGAEHLESDRWVWTVGIPGRAQVWLAAQDEEMRSFLEAFATGFNDYAARHPEAIADDAEVVLPITPADLLAHIQRVIHFTFVANPYEVAAARRQFQQASTAPAPQAMERREQAGSNAWAIGPDRSASGNALLIANPHLPWSDLFTWFEAQLVSPQVDIYGATLVGTPFLAIGFNGALGWTHTVNTHDGRDFFELTLEDGGYRFDDQVRAFDSEDVTLSVRQEDGSLSSETLEIQRSLHGPVVAVDRDRALALAVVGLESPQLTRQYWDMARATNLAEFETAIRPMQMPMFTFMYADRAGNILHHFGGETPIRPQGDWARWSVPVPGDTSSWNWAGIHAFDDLPTVRNPGSGWLQNANDPPWTTTFPRPLDASDFPLYMAPHFMHLRAQRSAGMAGGDDSITFEEAVGYKFSSRMELADRILDDLGAAVAVHGDSDAHQAMEVLETWDRQADAGSRGAVLFAEFFEQMQTVGQSLATPSPATGFAVSWSGAEPLTTPDGLAEPALAASALSAAARAVRERYGELDIAWGEAYRLQRGDYDHPASGGPGAFGIFRVVGFAANDDGTSGAIGGDSWIGIVEFAEPPRAQVLLTYGNASQPGSPHNGDQLGLYSQNRLRTAWRSRAEIEANLERREVLTPP